MNRSDRIAHSISELKMQRRNSWVACIFSVVAIFAAIIGFASKVGSSHVAGFFLAAFIVTSLVTAFMAMFFAFTRSDRISSIELQYDADQLQKSI